MFKCNDKKPRINQSKFIFGHPRVQRSEFLAASHKTAWTDWIHIDTCWQLQSLIARYHERQNKFKVLATHLLTEERPAGRCLPKRPIIPSRALFNAPGAPVHASSCWFHGGLSYVLRCGSLPNYTNLECQPIGMWPLQFRIVEGDGHIIFSLE